MTNTSLLGHFFEILGYRFTYFSDPGVLLLARNGDDAPGQRCEKNPRTQS